MHLPVSAESAISNMPVRTNNQFSVTSVRKRHRSCALVAGLSMLIPATHSTPTESQCVNAGKYHRPMTKPPKTSTGRGLNPNITRRLSAHNKQTKTENLHFDTHRGHFILVQIIQVMVFAIFNQNLPGSNNYLKARLI